MTNDHKCTEDLLLWNPLRLAALRLAGESGSLEDLANLPDSLPWPQESNDLVYYLGGQNSTLWDLWLLTKPRPFFVKGYRMGWACTAGTTAQAAAAEGVLGLMHGWRLRVCKTCGRFFTGKACDRCAAGSEERKAFLHLLAIHRGRFPEAAGEIERLGDRIKQGNISLAAAKTDYEDRIRPLYGIPTAWVAGKRKKGKTR